MDDDWMMDAAEKRTSEILEPSTWAEICERCPNEWVCLVGVQHEPSGAISCGRVVGHSSSMKAILAQLGSSNPDQVIVHTSGRSLQSPRIEPTNEVRDIVRSRR